MMAEIDVVEYSPSFQVSFKELNEAWIQKYFELEEEDINTLNQPEKIIAQGGYIFVALKDSEAVGVCALRKTALDTYEFSKMAVSENFQGLGIGRKLAETAINKARQMGARRIYLEGNTRLAASIHLYKKLGFKEIVGPPSKFKRVNIVMEMLLD
jgi:putative acetyltransferase